MAIEQIDAAIFSGDAFIDPANRKSLREYFDRWERGLEGFDRVFPNSACATDSPDTASTAGRTS